MNTMKNCMILLAALLLAACAGKKSRQMTLEESDLVQQEMALTLPEGLVFAENVSSADSTTPTPGVRYRGTKRVDPASPPVVLTPSASLPQKALDLAKLYPVIEYVKLRHPLADKGYGFLDNKELRAVRQASSSFIPSISSSTYAVGDYIVAGDAYSGYHAYDLTGKYLYTLSVPDALPVKSDSGEENRFTVQVNDNGKAINSIILSGGACMILTRQNGAIIAEIHDPATRSVFSRPYVYTPNPDRGFGSMQPALFDKDVIVEHSISNMEPSSPFILFKEARTGNTLTEYLSHNPRTTDQPRAFSYADPGLMSHYDGQMTIRQVYNDTVFRAASPERLTAAYVLDLGESKVTLSDVVTGNTKGKLAPRKWLETDKFVYLSHFDGDSTNVHSYYDKTERQLNRIATTNLTEGLPLLDVAQSAAGGLSAGFTKSQLEKLIGSDLFGTFPAAEQEKIRNFQQEMTDGEMLVMRLR